jgi:serine/threonine-protein kinase
MALLARHSLDNVPSLKIVRGTVPDAVEDAIVRAMAKVPADRFHSAIDFANALTDDEGAARRRANSLKAKAIAASTMAELPAAGGRRKTGLIAALVAVPLLFGAGWFAWSKTKGSAAADPRLAAMKANEIAVLYFDDRSQDHSLRYLADGLTEALIHELGTVKALNVTSRNGVMRFKGKDVTPDSIARALNVGTIVSGTVAASGDQIRVTVDMLDARTGESIGSTEIRKMKADAFALQDTLVTEVSSALRKQLGQQVQVLTSKAGTSNAAAWEGYQRANQTVSEGDSLLAAGNPPAAIAVYARADTALGKVGGMDGKWVAPPAMQGLLDYRIARLSLGAGVSVVSEWIESGLPKANRAVSLAPNDADALEARGSLRYLKWLLNLGSQEDADNLLAGAEADLKASVAANKTQASAMNTLSHLYHFTNRILDANLMALNAYKADPYLLDVNKTILRLFQTSLDLNNAQQSKQWCDEGARRFPDDYRFAECRLWLLTLPDPATAPTAAQIWKANDDYLAMDKVDKPEFAKRKGMMLAGIALIRAGLKDSAESVITHAQGNETIDPAGDLVQLEAMARAQLGQKERVISLLRRQIAAHPQQKNIGGHDESWWFKSLQDDPQYKALFTGGQ